MPSRRFAVSCKNPIALMVLSACPALLSAQTNVLTWHNDNSRTGQTLNEPTLNPAAISSSTFGLLYQVALDGVVDAQPLYISGLKLADGTTRNVVFAATEHDTVYALDSDTGDIIWQSSMLGTNESASDDHHCKQITPEIGVSATPVISLQTGPHGTMYVVATSLQKGGKYHQRLHALDIATGAEQFGGPVELQGRARVEAGDKDDSGSDADEDDYRTFHPRQFKAQAGLLLSNGNVYVSMTGHCEQQIRGWMMSYDQNTLAQTGAITFAAHGSGAAPGNNGAAPAADLKGNVFLSLGEGSFDQHMNTIGFPDRGNYGNSVVKVSLLASVLGPKKLDQDGHGDADDWKPQIQSSPFHLGVTDYWHMSNAQAHEDFDLGSAGTLLLPDLTDASGKTRHLAVTGGKNNDLFVLDRDNLGKFSGNPPYQLVAGVLPNGAYSSPAWFNNHVYFGSRNAPLRSFSVSQAMLLTSPSSETAFTFADPGTTPSVSSNQGQGGVVWTVEVGDAAVLHAFDANDLGVELYNSTQAANDRDNIGAPSKYAVPTIADGKVFVGSSNALSAFSLTPNLHIPDGSYTIVNHSSHLFLDDPNGSKTAGDVIQNSANGAADEHWFFKSDGNGYYWIQNGASGLMLTDPNAVANPGTTLQEQPQSNTDAQLWSFIGNQGGFVIQNKATQLVLDDNNRNPNPGVPIILWPYYNYLPNQVWAITPY